MSKSASPPISGRCHCSIVIGRWSHVKLTSAHPTDRRGPEFLVMHKLQFRKFLIKWMCCSIVLLEHNPTMSSLRHNTLESHSKNPQRKHVWSTNMTCLEITMVVRTYQVCALTMFALNQNFRVVVLQHKLHVHLWQLFSKTLCTVRLQLYKSCTMMFALVSIIYPRITMVGQYSDIGEHLQTFNIDYLGTSKMDISWLCCKHSIYIEIRNIEALWMHSVP